MKHIHIIFLVINLIIGSAVIFYAGNLNRKFKQHALKKIREYLISFNLLIFVDFIYKYTLYNINNSNLDNSSSLQVVILYFLVSLAEFGMVWFLYEVSESLKMRKRSRLVTGITIAVAFVYAAGSATGIIYYFNSSDTGWVYIVHMVWVFTFLTMIMAILAGLMIHSLGKGIVRHPLLLRLPLLLTPGYLLLAISNADFYFMNNLFSDFDPLIFFLINLGMFAWLKYFAPKFFIIPFTDSAISESFDRVIIDYKISDREIEIIKLIVEGKSNKEIEDQLSISFNTVKNHIYNIYRKLDVNSRSQLIRLINQYPGKDLLG